MGTTTWRQSNEALSDDDPRKDMPAAPVEWHHVEGCPPNVESEKLFEFVRAAQTVYRALVWVNPDGMVFIDFRKSLMVADDLTKNAELWELFGTVWGQPYDGHKYTHANENRILSQPTPPWMIRRGRGEHYEPLRQVEEDADRRIAEVPARHAAMYPHASLHTCMQLGRDQP